MWYGTSAKFNKLRGILYNSMEVITKISTLGWQKTGFFAFGNGIVFNGEWHPVNEEGIVRLGNPLGSFYLPAFSKMNEDNSEKFLFEAKSGSFNLPHKCGWSMAIMPSSVFVSL